MTNRTNPLAIILPISQMKTAVHIDVPRRVRLTHRKLHHTSFPFSTDYAPFLYARYILTYIHSIAEQRRLGSKNSVTFIKRN